MKSIHIRGVPDETYASLQARAAATGLSLSEFLLLEVARIARRPPLAEALRDAQDRYWGVGTAEPWQHFEPFATSVRNRC